MKRPTVQNQFSAASWWKLPVCLIKMGETSKSTATEGSGCGERSLHGQKSPAF